MRDAYGATPWRGVRRNGATRVNSVTGGRELPPDSIARGTRMRSRAIGPVLALAAVFCAGLLLKGAAPAVPTGQWQPGAAISHARTGAIPVALADGRVLLVGGRDAAGPTAAVDIVGTNGAITPAAPMSIGRVGHAATRLPD